MRWIFLVVLLVHGVVHFMGFAKGFGLAELPALTQPVSRPGGVAWLMAGLAMLATGGLAVSGVRWWWVVGVIALLLSQSVIASSWSDAKFGTIVNLLVLAGVVYGFASQGPLSFRAAYRREVNERVRSMVAPPLVTRADLERLPEPVQRYMRLTGVLGQPRVKYFTAEWRGRIRSAANEPWMEFSAVQYNFPTEPARFFRMDATRGGLPVDVYHAFSDGAATMRVRLLSLLPVVNAHGPEITRAEVVTLLNDLCLLAPAALIDSSIRWEPIDDRSARARYTVGSNVVGAVLHFNEDGELVDFVSDDRLVVSPDGSTFTQQRWSTPVGDYRSFGPLRLMSRGEGRWHPPDGEFTYIELELVRHNVNSARSFVQAGPR